MSRLSGSSAGRTAHAVVLIVPPSGFSELPPLFCRSPSKLLRNDCNAAVPDGFDVVELVLPLVDAAGLEAAAGVTADGATPAGVPAAGAVLAAGVAVVAELPPRALINWLKALLRFAIAFDDKLEPVVLVTI